MTTSEQVLNRDFSTVCYTLQKQALIKYPGAKWRIAEWITGFFPEHHSYLEPYLGSGAVLFRKKPSHIETVNDLDGEVVNFFDCLRADPERLASMVSLTPYARQEYEKAYTEQSEPFHRAHSFLIRLQMGHGFRTCGERVGWKMDVQGRERAYAVRDWNRLPERLLQAAERLKEVQIESRPALDVIERFNFPNVLIYCDPPYLLGTRCRKQYRCEMTDAEHYALLETLRDHKGKVIISGYESAMYDDLLRSWHKEIKNNLANNSQKRTEVLWMNFDPNNDSGG